MIKLITDNLVLDHDYTKGHVMDYSGNNNDGTLSNGEGFLRSRGSWAYKPLSSTSRVTVSYNSSLDLVDTATFVLYGNFSQDFEVLGRFLAKVSGGVNFRLYPPGAGILAFASASTAQVVFTGNEHLNAKTIIITKPSGNTKFRVYLDGVFYGESNTTVELTQSDSSADLTIGSEAGSAVIRNSLSSLLIYSDTKTASEVAQIHKAVITRKTPWKQKKNFYTAPSVGIPTDGSAWNMDIISGKVIDQGVNNVTGTVANSVRQGTTPWGEKSAIFDSTDEGISCGVESTLDFTTESFGCFAWVKPSIFGSGVVVMGNATAALRGWYLALNSSGNVLMSTFQSGASQNGTSSGALIANTWNLIGGISLAGDNNISYINGAQSGSGIVRIDPATSSNNFSIGDYVTSSLGYQGEIGPCRAFEISSQAEFDAIFKDEWNRIARLPLINEDFSDAFILNGTISSGNPIPGTQWTVGAQAAKIVDGINTGDKALQASGFGHWSYTPMNPDRKYGRFVWKYKAEVTAGFRNRMALSSVSTLASGTYIMVEGQEVGKLKVSSVSNANHLTTEAGSIQDGQIYEIWLDIRPGTSNNCTLYINGEPAVADSGTNPFTFTSSDLFKWVILAPYNSSEVYLFRHEFGVPIDD